MTPSELASEDHLNEILLGYVEAVERGESPDRAALLAAHPEFAAELAEFFAGQDRLAAVGSPALTDPADTTADTPARSFGDYELIEEIGRGGMGVVYRARQKSLNRTVALKMILAGQFASPAELARFRAEAETVAALDHPHIVPVHAVGEHDGRPYFAMKL